MKILHIPLFFLCLLSLAVSPAWGQFGLYGAPEMVGLPQAAPPVGPQAVYAAPPAYAVSRTAPPYAVEAGIHDGQVTQAAASYPSTATPVSLAAPKPPAVPKPPAAPSPAGAHLAPAARLPDQQQPQSANVVDKMLDEANGQVDYGYADYGCADCGESCDASSPFRQTLDRFRQAAMGGCDGGACGQERFPWYCSTSALVMTRNKGNKVWLSYEDGDESNQLMNTNDIDLAWREGAEVRLGRRFCGCGQHWALEGVYWTLQPFYGRIELTDPSGLATPLQFNEVFLPNPSPPPATVNADEFFGNAAAEHVLRRSNKLYNIEINLVNYPMAFGCDSRLDLNWLVGARFFRFEENLLFGSLQGGGWTWDDLTHQAFLSDRIYNNLIGFQFGCEAGYQVCCTWRVFVAPKFGIYNNHIRNSFELFRGDGQMATQTAYPGESYPVNSHTDCISFLTQVDLGVEWQFAENWSAQVGYRVVAITGVGLADNQIPPYVVDIPEIRDIDTNGDLILHGAFAGVRFNF